REALAQEAEARPAAIACLAGHHGRSVPLVRPPLPAGDGAVAAAEVAATGAALQALEARAGEVEQSPGGASAAVPGRPFAGIDEQRGGARQPALSQGAEEHLRGADAAALGTAARLGH